MQIFVVLAALVVGAVVGFLIAKVKASRLETNIRILDERLAEKEKTFRATISEKEKAAAEAIKEKERSFNLILNEKDRLHAEAIHRQDLSHRDALEALQGRFDETVAKMKSEIENLTAKMLKERQSEFEESSRESVSKIIGPLNASIEQMRQTVADNTMKHSEFGGQLTANIKLVLEQSDAARKSADRLADALRGSNRIQGNWGETVLTELLESQGLTEGIHFDTQACIRDKAGNLVRSEQDTTMRPDIILHLDNERDVIIDAKVSLSAYLDYMQAESEEKRETALQNHVRSIESHVAELARKDYSKYIATDKKTVDYVIMFIPNTTALYAATSRKPELWRKAMERGVYIADEQTLYAALKIIALTWRQIRQADNHEKVYKLAEEMLSRVDKFMLSYQTIGKKLAEAQKSYEEAFGKLKESGQSIPTTCRKLIELGAKAKPSKGVSPQLLGLTEDMKD